jgi:hypothetical protein
MVDPNRLFGTDDLDGMLNGLAGQFGHNERFGCPFLHATDAKFANGVGAIRQYIAEGVQLHLFPRTPQELAEWNDVQPSGATAVGTPITSPVDEKVAAVPEPVLAPA